MEIKNDDGSYDDQIKGEKDKTFGSMSDVL
jgi:hypothetical protein